MTIDERRETRDALRALVDAYQETRTGTPRETVDALAARLAAPSWASEDLGGMAAALWTIATAVNGVGAWDGRISPRARDWAAAFPYTARPEALQEAGIYAPSDIHPAHLDQLAREAVQISAVLDLDRR